jgi:Domain of unknown function (DUF4386)
MPGATLTDFSELETRPPRPRQLDGEAQPTDWHTLFQLAGISALAVVAMIPIQGIVYILWSPPTTVVEYFRVFQTNPVLGFLDLDLLLVFDQLLIVSVLLALYVALREADPSVMLIGLAAGLLGATLMIVSREATLSMFSLSQQYTLASSAEQRAALEAAGQTLLTVYNGTAFSLGYFLTGLGLLLISTVMLRSSVFTRFTGFTGIAAGATGLIPASIGTLGFAVSLVSLVPLIVWLFLVGRRFLQLSSTPQKRR